MYTTSHCSMLQIYGHSQYYYFQYSTTKESHNGIVLVLLNGFPSSFPAYGSAGAFAASIILVLRDLFSSRRVCTLFSRVEVYSRRLALDLAALSRLRICTKQYSTIHLFVSSNFIYSIKCTHSIATHRPGICSNSSSSFFPF